MCGIIGCKGENASKYVLEGLKKLEYRGYDSWGVALNYSKIKIIKKIGTINGFEIPNSDLAIGHTRWATHGKVNKTNSHPHSDCHNKIIIVHNGIIENYQELKKELIYKKHIFKSETDSEIIAHLIEEYNKKNNIISSINLAIKRLKGSFALLILNNDKLIAVKKNSPLIIGKSKNNYFLASDIQAFIKYTNNIIYLENNEIAIIDKKLRIIKNNKELKKDIIKINRALNKTNKKNFPHYMLKEIFDQKNTIKNIINNNKEIKKLAKEINTHSKIFFLGCGTAYYASLTSSYLFSKIAKKHIICILGSEYKYYNNFIDKNTLIIPVSQSGETADILDSVKKAKAKGAKIISVINTNNSSLEKISDYSISIKAGPEIAVASTKAFTSQIALLTLASFICINKYEKGIQELQELSKKINDILNQKFIKKIDNLSKKIINQDLFIIGKNSNYPIALESALKIKEISYIHAEGFSSGELKHGTLALIEKKTPCLVLCSKNKNIISNALEIKSRGAYIIGISHKYNKIFDYWIKLPKLNLLSPILNVIPSQLLAYYLALNKKLNPDRPRNLAKSVTVK